MNPLPKKESETLEYKESLNEKEEAGQTLCGFANQKGGVVYFGVKNNGQTVGIQELGEKTLRELAEYLKNGFEPQVDLSIEEETIEGHSLIKVQCNKSMTPFHTFKKVAYLRVGTTTQTMSAHTLQSRLTRNFNPNPDFSAMPIEASMDDLSPQAIQELRKLLSLAGKDRYSQKIDTLSDQELLKNLSLVRNGKLTIAAVVLLGTEQGLEKILPYAEIRYGYRISENEVRNQSMEIFKGGYLTYFQRIWREIDRRNINISVPQGLLLLEKKAFEEQTIREALNNATIHRDYQNNESIFIIQYPSSIQIKSPGGFVEGVSIENILKESKPRNKLLSDILFKCGLVEQFGSGYYQGSIMRRINRKEIILVEKGYQHKETKNLF